MSNNGPGTDFGKGDYDLDRVILRLVWKYPILAIKGPDEGTVRWVVKQIESGRVDLPSGCSGEVGAALMILFFKSSVRIRHRE